MAATDSESTMDITSQVVGAVINDEKVLRLFYQDLARPGVRQVGKALSTVLGLGNTVLLPLKMANAKAHALYTRHMEQYRKNLEQVSPEKIVEVAPEIGVPILENLEKTSNETISQLYINLLTNASQLDLASQVHPRFVSVIESLTRDEAVILNDSRSDILFITINFHLTFVHKGQTQHGVSANAEKATKYHKSDLLLLPERADFYFDNLRGLGLLTEHMGNSRFKVFGDAYADLKEQYKQESIGSGLAYERVEILEGSYEKTPFCMLFQEACSFPSGPKAP